MAVNFRGSFSSFATSGLASTPHNLLALSNKAASGMWIAVYEIALYRDMTALQSTITPWCNVVPPTALPTGGTALAASRDHDDSARSVSANVECLGATASDAGAATAITATAGATPIWRSGTSRMHTLAGIVLVAKVDCLPDLCKTQPLVLAPSERLLVQLVNNGVAGDRNLLNVSFAEWSTATG